MSDVDFSPAKKTASATASELMDYVGEVGGRIVAHSSKRKKEDSKKPKKGADSFGVPVKQVQSKSSGKLSDEEQADEALTPPNTAEKKKRRVGNLVKNINPRGKDLLSAEASVAVEADLSQNEFLRNVQENNLATQCEIKVFFFLLVLLGNICNF